MLPPPRSGRGRGAETNPLPITRFNPADARFIFPQEILCKFIFFVRGKKKYADVDVYVKPL